MDNEPVPAFIIRVNRDQSLPTETIRHNPDFDKYFDDEIEQPSITRERFDELLAKAIMARIPNTALKSLQDNRIEISVPGGNNIVSYTENAWKDSWNQPGHRKERLRSYIAFNEKTQEELMHFKLSDIVPVIRSSALASQAREDKIDLRFFDVAPGLICMLAADSPDSLRYLTKEEIEQNNFTDENIKDLPVKNLMTHLPGDVYVYGSEEGFLIAAGGDFESSLILSDRFMAAMQKQIKGRMIFAVPNKDLLSITGDAKQGNIDRLRELINSALNQGSRPISDKIYLWENGKITVYQ